MTPTIKDIQQLQAEKRRKILKLAMILALAVLLFFMQRQL